MDPAANSLSTSSPPTAPHDEPDRDAAIMSVAAKQHGVVTRAQLVEAGVPAHAIDYRVGRRRLHRLYRGVYRVGTMEANYEKETAAVLACGEAAVLSHRSAAGLWKMLPLPSAQVPVEVTILRGCRTPGPSVRVHRFCHLDPAETTRFEGIPVTVPARTLLDLAGSVNDRRIEQALAAALREHLTDRDQIRELLARYPRRSGAPLLRALVDRDREPAFTRSEAEARFLKLARKARLQGPQVNARVSGYEVDFLWQRQRLIVEIDGFAFHSSPGAFERDRRRDAVLTGAGFRVVRVTWRQVTKEPEALLVSLARALARGG
jgi:very-short-patch-repair endonuclease/predicted transcriptional regulator of viral defense system